jgi:peptide/nickel transport system substrate-binding protein/oligopeptide transport system substrate-binding protein
LLKQIRNLLFIAACALLFGCGRSQNGNGEAAPGSFGPKVFNYSNIEEPKKLDPAYSYDVYEGIISGLMFDGLVLFDNGTNIVPGLAEKWEISPDGKVYTFHLRDAKFSNGKTVTSADVRYSFTRILRPETNSDRKWLFDRIVGADAVSSGTTRELKGLETPDAKTVKITLTRPYVPFLTKLAMPSAVIIPENSAGTDKPSPAFEAKPIGSGPWVLDRWLHDQRLEFHRNDKFWGHVPDVERFNYHIQIDPRVTQRQFEVGNFDILDIDFTIYSQYVRDPEKRKRMIESPELNTYFVGILSNKPKLKDKRVRQALAYAVDTKSIFENLQKGRGTWAYGPVPPGINGYRPDLKPREYNPDKARQLLAEAGATNLELDLWYRDEALGTEMMTAVQKDLEKIGVKVNVFRRDWATVREAIYNGTPDLYFSSWWLDYPDIENAIEPYFASANIPRQGNGAHFSNPEVDKLIADAEAEADADKRIAKFQKAEDAIIDECPWIFLYHRKSYVVVQPWVKGYKPSLMYNSGRFEDVDIDQALKAKR